MSVRDVLRHKMSSRGDFGDVMEHEQGICVQQGPPSRLGLCVLGERCKVSRFQP